MIIKQKGTYDIYGIDAKKRQYIKNVLDTLSDKYGYGFIETPVFEATELFHRSVGDESDIVKKETYDFKDRGDRNISLRPEGTAGVVRWFVENKLYGNLTDPVKVFYCEKMYRYERPQSGRQREFTQWGFECFGSDFVESDAEVISLAYNAYKLLGLENVKVKINSLGDDESRDNYRKALVDYLKPYKDELCEDCKRRLETNPLRVLDCKIDGDSDILKNVPKIIDYLNEESKNRFDKLLELLDLLEIDYEIDPNIVRGLDYYNYTVFEIVLNDSLALGAGGRYNNLVESLGGESTPAVGFAMGLDRVVEILDNENIEIPIEDSIDVYILGESENERNTASILTQTLRLNSFSCEMDMMNKTFKNQFKAVDRMNAKYLILLKDDDIKENVITIKDNKTREEEKISIVDLVDYLDTHI